MNLFLLEDLEDVSRTRELPESDLDALRAVADWIKTFTDLSADRAKELFDDVLEDLAVPSYVKAEELPRLPWRAGRD